MRLVMLATGPFAVPTFRALYETHHEVTALVTSPVRPRAARNRCRSRSSATWPTNTARRSSTRRTSTRPTPGHGWPRFEPDLLVVCDYGQILSADTLATARLGGINLHASLLPKYRGAAPINWAIYHGEAETGVTVIHMTPKVDAGPCIAQARTGHRARRDGRRNSKPGSAEVGAWLVRRTIDTLEAGTLEALPQNPALASKRPG